MHLFYPIAKAVHYHPPDDRMIGVEGVSSAAVIGVTRAILFKNVIGTVVQAAKTQGWPVLIAFGCVVEDNVENDFDTRPVQRLDHIPELVERPKWILPRAVSLKQHKK